MACTTLIPYTGVMPKSGGLTVEEEIAACVAYRAWHQDTYIPWLVVNFPTICAASDMAATLFDTSNYQGVFDSEIVYSLGQSVSVGNDIYISNININNSTPPSLGWVLIRSNGVKKSSDGLAIVNMDDSYIKNQCTAWVSIDPRTTPPTILDGYNVLSVTKLAGLTDYFTITFESDMDNANYVVAALVIGTDNNDGNQVKRGTVYDVSSFKVITHETYLRIDLIVFGGKA